MYESTSREKVLKKIRKALIAKSPARNLNVDWDKPIYNYSSETPEVSFAEAFSKVGGKFIYCNNEVDFLEKLLTVTQEKRWKNFYCWEERVKELLNKVDFPYTSEEKHFEEEMVGLTLCEALIARTGSVFVSARQAAGRRLPVIGSSHAVVAFTSQIVPDIKDAFQRVKNTYNEQLPSMMTLITGPSRTADIEKTLVTGAHGPKEIFVFLIDDHQ